MAVLHNVAAVGKRPAVYKNLRVPVCSPCNPNLYGSFQKAVTTGRLQLVQPVGAWLQSRESKHSCGICGKVHIVINRIFLAFIQIQHKVRRSIHDRISVRVCLRQLQVQLLRLITVCKQEGKSAASEIRCLGVFLTRRLGQIIYFLVILRILHDLRVFRSQSEFLHQIFVSGGKKVKPGRLPGLDGKLACIAARTGFIGGCGKSFRHAVYGVFQGSIKFVQAPVFLIVADAVCLTDAVVYPTGFTVGYLRPHKKDASLSRRCLDVFGSNTSCFEKQYLPHSHSFLHIVFGLQLFINHKMEIIPCQRSFPFLIGQFLGHCQGSLVIRRLIDKIHKRNLAPHRHRIDRIAVRKRQNLHIVRIPGLGDFKGFPRLHACKYGGLTGFQQEAALGIRYSRCLLSLFVIHGNARGIIKVIRSSCQCVVFLIRQTEGKCHIRFAVILHSLCHYERDIGVIKVYPCERRLCGTLVFRAAHGPPSSEPCGRFSILICLRAVSRFSVGRRRHAVFQQFINLIVKFCRNFSEGSRLSALQGKTAILARGPHKRRLRLRVYDGISACRVNDSVLFSAIRAAVQFHLKPEIRCLRNRIAWGEGNRLADFQRSLLSGSPAGIAVCKGLAASVQKYGFLTGGNTPRNIIVRGGILLQITVSGKAPQLVFDFTPQ